MKVVNFDANWWAFGHCIDESDLIAEAVGLEAFKLKNLTTGKAMDILADAAKWKIPQGKNHWTLSASAAQMPIFLISAAEVRIQKCWSFWHEAF